MPLFFKEIRGSVLLKRKAKALNEYYDQLEAAGRFGVLIDEKNEVRRSRWKVKNYEQHETFLQVMRASCYCPFREYYRFRRKMVNI
jgi:hypothetical protein